jgi:type VI secretion system protein ImpK
MTPAPSATQGPGDAARAVASPRRGQLALALQEPFTAIARLRANRQVASDAASFRDHMKQVLSAAEQVGRRTGYTEEHVRLALFAVVVFLDESVLNSGQPMFAEWPRRPLQEEIFGSYTGGEQFFQYLHQLLQLQDSEDLADLLEVYELCLLLGFRGRYGATGGSELQILSTQMAEKMGRIRGPAGELSPAWRPSTEPVRIKPDRWVPRLAALMIVTGAGAIVLFIFLAVALHSGRADVQASLAQIGR